mgnify:CR=1 FL=1|jgi:hypothetical protein
MSSFKAYDSDTEEYMQLFASTLNERDKRRYAAVEAKKLGHGGITYISDLLNISTKTIQSGLEELSKKKLDSIRIRSLGAGRPYIEKTYPALHDCFLELLASYTAGCPMNEGLRWTYLNAEEIRDKLADQDIFISITTVRLLLNLHGFKRRKIAKTATIKEVANRDAQFTNIDSLVAQYQAIDCPILSMDTKKKEWLGSFYRAGKIYTLNEAAQAWDHDFSSMANGQMIPHGLYDQRRNEAYMHLGTSRDTAEFALDALLSWWENHGVVHYNGVKKLLLLCDGGGSNNCRHYLFKEAIHLFTQKTGLEVRVAHYPAYCSKYNPIEHRVFPYVTKALKGIMIDSVKTAKKLIEQRAKTKTGLKVFAKVIEKQYEKGKKASKEFLDKLPIIFDDFLPLWNYKTVPKF